MNIIEKLAHNSYKENLKYSKKTPRQSVRNISLLVSDFDKDIDKINFLNIHLDIINEEYSKHLKVCKNPNDCPQNLRYETISFFLNQELVNLNFQNNEDSFTLIEKIEKKSQIDDILKRLEEINLGNQIIYDDLYNEINELKDLLFLDKKNWHQLLAGKIFEMTASGVVSETISKELINIFKPITNLLIK